MKPLSYFAGPPDQSAVVTRSEAAEIYAALLGHSPENDDIVDKLLARAASVKDFISGLVTSEDYRGEMIRSYRPPQYRLDAGPYFAKSLSDQTRRAIFCFHYMKMFEIFDNDTVRRLAKGVPLWQARTDHRAYDVTLTVTPMHQWEGELSLLFRVDGSNLFTFSFNLVPGRLLNATGACALLLTRMQGVLGVPVHARQAARDLKGVAPQAALMAALDGVARALQIGEVIVVSAANQIHFKPEREAMFRQAYDDFMRTMGAAVDGPFFRLRSPMPAKPLSEVNPQHRQRARGRQDFRARIAATAEVAMRALMETAGAAPARDPAASPPDIAARDAQLRRLEAAVADLQAQNEALRLKHALKLIPPRGPSITAKFARYLNGWRRPESAR